MAYSSSDRAVRVRKRMTWVLIIIFVSFVVYTGYVYHRWNVYNRNLNEKYLSTTKLVLQALETTLLKDITNIAAMVFTDRAKVPAEGGIKYIAYDKGNLFRTNIPSISGDVARSIYQKIREYMNDEPLKVIPRMHLTYYGVVFGFIPSWDKDKFLVVSFPARYLESDIYRNISASIAPKNVTVLLFTKDGLPIATGDIFSLNAFNVKDSPRRVIVSDQEAVTYVEGRFLSMVAVYDGNNIFPFSYFLLNYYLLFTILAYLFYGTYHYLELRYFAPLDDLQDIYTSYVKSGTLNKPLVIKHRRDASNYLYPANIIYVLLYHLSAHLDEYEILQNSLASIYSLFSRLSEDFDENDTVRLNAIMDNIRDILDVDGVFLMVREGEAYIIKASAGINVLSHTGTMKVYSNYWNKFFRGDISPHVETIVTEGKGVKDAIVKGLHFMTMFKKAIIVPLGFSGMVEGLLVVLIKDESGRNMRLLEDLASIIAYMLTSRIMLARLRASADEIVLNSLVALISALEVKDPYTAGHSSRVALYSKILAEKIGLSPEDVDRVYKAALLHDMGKEGVPDRILLKPAPLTKDEWEHMKRHPIISASIIEKLGRFHDLLPGILHHHTRYDGGGYPGGLSGEDLPLIARIIAVADAFDAMTTDRPYRHALPDEVAISELRKWSGQQFDPALVDAFIELYENGEVDKVRSVVPSPLSFRSPEIMEKVFRTSPRFMFLVFDINGLFYINKKYGTHIGDNLLHLIERILEHQWGDIAQIGRLDGDHVAALIEADFPTRQEIEELIRHIEKALADILPDEEGLLKVAVLSYPDDYTDRRSVLHYASVLLSLAKALNVSAVFMSDILSELRGE